MSGSYKFVFLRDCTPEAMGTQGAFSLFQRVALSHEGSSKTFHKFQKNATVQG